MCSDANSEILSRLECLLAISDGFPKWLVKTNALKDQTRGNRDQLETKKGEKFEIVQKFLKEKNMPGKKRSQNPQ
jgi:hypothetical protein